MSKSPNNREQGSDVGSWETKGNSIVIWLFIIGLFAVLILSSYDFSKPYFNLILFGNYQILLVAFITFLLLHRYIDKIKIGNVAEIEIRKIREAVGYTLASNEETRKAVNDVINTLSKLDSVDGETDSEIIKDAENKINESLEYIKKARRTLQDL